MRKSAVERIMEKVKIAENGCWVWISPAVCGSGYGRINVDGMTKNAHRVMYEAFRGPIPKGLFACHTCDDVRCVNPCHIFIGDHAQNMVDRNKKNRQSKGIAHGGAKLTEEQVKNIRKAYAGGGVTQESLAKEHGVGCTAVRNAISRKTWRHI